jgi:hypothetical protein
MDKYLKKNAKKSKTTTKKNAKYESDSESDEDIKTTKKKSIKLIKNQSTSDSESDEDVKPKTKCDDYVKAKELSDTDENSDNDNKKIPKLVESESIKILDRDEIRLQKLKKFYKNSQNLETFVNIVTGNFPKKNLSLRILDWFVTNYAREKDIIIKYKSKKDGSIISFDVHGEYKNQLTAYGKKGYDQFCRSGKLLYPYRENGKKKYVETTIAQLNFFKWAITEKIINYVVKHFDEIFEHMNNAKKERDIEKNKIDSGSGQTEYDKEMNKYLNNSSVEYSLETELSTPINKVNILEFSEKKPKLEKYIKTKIRSQHTKTKGKQLNKCTGKVKIEFK